MQQIKRFFFPLFKNEKFRKISIATWNPRGNVKKPKIRKKISIRFLLITPFFFLCCSVKREVRSGEAFEVYVCVEMYENHGESGWVRVGGGRGLGVL